MKDRIIGICTIILCAFLLFTLRDESLQTMLFPLILIISLLVISFFIAIRKDPKVFHFENFRMIVYVGILFGLYIIVMPYAGFLISTTCFLGSFLLLAKFNISKFGVVLVAIGVSLAIWFVFSVLFKVQLPEILF